ERNIGSIQAGPDDTLDRHVPAVALVLVLALGSEIGDLLLHLGGGAAAFAAEEVMADRARRGRGPDSARDELQQLRLSGPVGASQHPAFPGPNGPADVLQRSEEHTSELQSPCNLVCRLPLEKK